MSLFSKNIKSWSGRAGGSCGKRNRQGSSDDSNGRQRGNTNSKVTVATFAMAFGCDKKEQIR
ncbi:MAG: hypothetical protein LBE57_02665 [Methanosarcinales archaeon]|nr:hypothetical protein [Methanosarcinales archaeon]